MSQFCTNCGAPMPEDANFCEVCGAGRSQEAAAPARGKQRTGAADTEGGMRRSAGRALPSGHFRKAALIGGAAVLVTVLVAVLGVLIIPALKNRGDGDAGTKRAQSEPQRQKPGAGMGGRAENAGTEDLLNIQIPAGYQIKSDAGLSDLIGEYEGEIQLTVMDGFEKMKGVPADFADEKARLLCEPIDCSLEVEEDGHWTIEWPIMGHDMTFSSRDYDDPEELTAAEIAALKITKISGGAYQAKLDLQQEEKTESRGHASLDHRGAYCTDGSDRIVAGNIWVRLSGNGMDVTLQGDFTVHKLTEDLSKDEGGSASAVSGTIDGVKIDALGRKAEALVRKTGSAMKDTRESGETAATVTGGSWVQSGDSWYYEKGGASVRNSWIEDAGRYYYVGEDGRMLRNACTPDGYYVDADGSYDPSASRVAPDRESGRGVISRGDASAVNPADFSTEEIAYATEFDWFIDYIISGGQENGRVVTDPALATRITDRPAALNGGWKAFMFHEEGVYGYDAERYFNAYIQAEKGRFNISMNWKYLFDKNEGSTVEESGSDMFSGTYDETGGTASAQSSYAKVDFDAFYLSTDGTTEYAVGTFYWISGETDRIALMRRAH